MYQQIVFLITFMILLGAVIALLVITESIFSFLYAFPILTFIAVILSYFYLQKRFNQSKYIHVMITCNDVYQTLLLSILLINLTSFAFSIIQHAYHLDTLEWYNTMTKIDNTRNQLCIAFGSTFLNALLCILTYKMNDHVLSILDNHYTQSNIRVFQNISTSVAALRENLIKITRTEFDGYLREQDACLICEFRFGLGQYIYRLKQCKHMFHSTCFSRWVNVPFHNSCPSCLRPL